MTFYFDGVETSTFTFTSDKDVSDMKMAVLFDLAVGGRFCNAADASTPKAPMMQVDWVARDEVSQAARVAVRRSPYSRYEAVVLDSTATSPAACLMSAARRCRIPVRTQRTVCRRSARVYVASVASTCPWSATSMRFDRPSSQPRLTA